jgi:dimethylamine monooxygenase subunit A
MPKPRFTPYDGSSEPFSIGLTQIAPESWIETDGDLGRYLAEKDRLLGEDRAAVFQALDGSELAQAETLDTLVAHLLDEHAAVYSRHGNTLTLLDRTIAVDAPEAPLLIAGSLVADDLVILEHCDGGWRVTAGYVAFPSSWSLKEKAGKTIGEIHDPVPDFEPGSRNDGLITRMFDRIAPGRVVERFNWSIYPEADLDWPPEKGARLARKSFDPTSNFVRVERQTLRKLPETGAMLFTIRIYQDPIAAVTVRPELAAQLAARLETMTEAQLAYKGMTEKREKLMTFLRNMP